MDLVVGLECLRCGEPYPSAHYADDCPRCRTVAPSNLTVAYAAGVRAPRQKPGRDADRGLWRYGDVLPVRAIDAVSLGEGDSPLHHLHRLGRSLRLPGLFAKDETRNPTWSFKDRLACVAVSVAKKIGARMIVSSSTGNAGGAVAAYAAKAKLPCIVFTTPGTAAPSLTQMRVYGAHVIAVEKAADRWTLMRHGVREFGWFPTSPFFAPAVGSNPYGIEGYKTLAYEIVEQLGWRAPDVCVLPACYGDALIGLWRGFEDMRAFGWIDRGPRLIAAEIYGSLSVALRNGRDVVTEVPMTHETVAPALGTTCSTFQALAAIRASSGTAIVVRNAEIMDWQQRLAREEGVYVEPASAGALAAVAQLSRTGRVGPGDTVVSILTAGGLKDPAATAREQGDLTVVPGDVTAAFAAMRRLGILPE